MFYIYEWRFAMDFIYLWDIYLTLFVNKSHIRYFLNKSTFGQWEHVEHADQVTLRCEIRINKKQQNVDFDVIYDMGIYIAISPLCQTYRPAVT